MIRTSLVRNGHLTRFHGIVSIGMPVLLAPVALWLLWRRSADPNAAATVAALIPVTYWGPFFVALNIPGAAIVDPGHHLARIGGVPSPLFGALATILVAGLGWYLDYRGRPMGNAARGQLSKHSPRS